MARKSKAQPRGLWEQRAELRPEALNKEPGFQGAMNPVPQRSLGVLRICFAQSWALQSGSAEARRCKGIFRLSASGSGSFMSLSQDLSQQPGTIPATRAAGLHSSWIFARNFCPHIKKPKF